MMTTDENVKKNRKDTIKYFVAISAIKIIFYTRKAIVTDGSIFFFSKITSSTKNDQQLC